MRQKNTTPESSANSIYHTVFVSGGNRSDRAQLTIVLRNAGYDAVDKENYNSSLPLEVEVDQGLSPREQEVLECASRGMADKEIGSELGISTRTVRYHIDRAMRKLGAHNRTEAVMRAGIGGRFL